MKNLMKEIWKDIPKWFKWFMCILLLFFFTAIFLASCSYIPEKAVQDFIDDTVEYHEEKLPLPPPKIRPTKITLVRF